MASMTGQQTSMAVMAGVLLLAAAFSTAGARGGDAAYHSSTKVEDHPAHHQQYEDHHNHHGHAVASCPKVFRHITLFKDAPSNATAVRNSLMQQWNKLHPKQRCLYWAVSFQVPGLNATSFPYNWGGFFDFNNQQDYDAFRTWLVEQPSFKATFAAINPTAVRHNQIVEAYKH